MSTVVLYDAINAVDATKAGAGNMEIIVSVDGHNVPNFVEAQGGAKFKVTFTPSEPGAYAVSVKFNRESVANSPAVIEVIDSPPPARLVAATTGAKRAAQDADDEASTSVSSHDEALVKRHAASVQRDNDAAASTAAQAMPAGKGDGVVHARLGHENAFTVVASPESTVTITGI